MIEIIKRMLGIEGAELDEKLSWIIESSKSRLKVLLGGKEIPAELDYIVIEVSIIRFNRIGSEGTKAHSVEGESYSFADNDFEGYMDDISCYLTTQNDATKGKVVFL